MFTISGDELLTAEVFNFESTATLNIDIRVTDSGGLSIEESFTIAVNDVNDVPSSIVLSETRIPLNTSFGAQIATFTTTDDDVADTFTYQLISGAGSAGNASFLIDGDKLLANADFSTDGVNYSIRMRSTDNGGLFVETEYVLIVSNLLLSNNSIVENLTTGTSVGNLSTEQGGNGTFSYSLIAGTGGTDNTFFTINSDEVLAAEAFNYEEKSSYSIRLKSTSSDDFESENTFIINITNQNEAPTALASSASSLDENSAIGTVVTTFSTTDVDAGDTFTYSFVSGTNDNDLFTISGDEVLAAQAFDFETITTLSIDIRSTDAGGLSLDKTFTLAVNDVNEAPTQIMMPKDSLFENMEVGEEVAIFSTLDPDTNDSHIYKLISGEGAEDNNRFFIQDDKLYSLISFDFESQTTAFVRVESTDANGASIESIFALSILDVDDAILGIEDEVELKVYPNPTTDYLRFDNSQNQIDKFSIINMEGKVVLFGEWKEEILVMDLKRGVYVIRFYSGKKVRKSKFIKR